MPFREWMRQALFDPDTGYYTTHVRTVGRRGDFSTSATAGTLLAEAVAGWLKAQLRAQPGVHAVIEVGGGSGVLSHVVRRSLGWWTRLRLRWHMVETSPVLREQQRVKLGPRAATWHDSMSAAMEAAEGRAFVFHNELVDAFPATLLQWDEPSVAWREIWMRRGEGDWQEELGAPVAGELADGTASAELQASALSRAGWPRGGPRQGQRIEVHWSYQEWLESWRLLWDRGAMLTIDYGDVFPAVYHRQPGGTLRAYFAQQRLSGAEVCQRMGKQDITADVNFTDLQLWGEKLGWSTEALETQTDFIRRYVGNASERGRSSAADGYVLDPEGAGGAFKTLVQHPSPAGVPAS
ncbi:SAM-dependent methyltransferase [Roseimicrobium gellanilyticum]|nr:SAM-dependent methyltransferase [Roseimicrobium gellanilyticum]